MNWDVFISHASEDKELVALPLAALLGAYGIAVWLDEYELRLGDSLRAKIDQGLAESRFGVVILSQSFFAKDWPQRELNGLAALESPQRKVILPVWHGVNQQVVAKYSPLLADKKAANTDRGLGAVASEILKVVIPLRAKEQNLPLDHFFQEDRDLFDDLISIFNRPAFRGTFLWQTDPGPFLRAMKLTLKAVNSGVIEDNNGVKQKAIKPITQIKDGKLFKMMQDVETHLKTTSNLIVLLKRTPDSDFAQREKIISEIDGKRDSIVGALNNIWSCFGLHTLPIPTQVRESTECLGKVLCVFSSVAVSPELCTVSVRA